MGHALQDSKSNFYLLMCAAVGSLSRMRMLSFLLLIFKKIVFLNVEVYYFYFTTLKKFFENSCKYSIFGAINIIITESIEFGNEPESIEKKIFLKTQN